MDKIFRWDIWKTIKTKEIARFIVVGSCAVLTDMTVYFLLLFVLSPSPSKTISFISGTIVAFFFNKYWTFERPGKSYGEAIKFVFLYTSTLLANVGVNKLSLIIMPDFIAFAFLAATGTSTILNFIGQKFWVFKKDFYFRNK